MYGNAVRALFRALPLLVLLAWALPAPAQDGQGIVVFGNDYKPPKISLQDGEPSGILVDILNWAGRQMGEHFDIRLFPWARAYDSAVAGEGGIVGLSLTTERMEIFDYSTPVFQDEVIMVVRKGEEFAYESLPDLRGLRVGIGQGGTFGDDFEEAARQGVFRVDYDVGPVPRLRKLLAGRIDVALLSPGRMALESTLAQDQELARNAHRFAVLDTPLVVDANYLAFAKSMHMTEFLARFNAVIEQGRRNGDINALIRAYTLPENQ